MRETFVTTLRNSSPNLAKSISLSFNFDAKIKEKRLLTLGFRSKSLELILALDGIIGAIVRGKGNRMKKSVLVIISLISVLFGGLASISPASAATTPHDTETVSYNVGDTVSLDVGCQEPYITDVHFYSGALPPGLAMDNQGVITGVPTTAGTYRVDGYSCTYNGGGGGANWYGYFLIFHIIPLSTPTPVLTAHSLNTSDCSFYLGFAFPSTPDTGSVYLNIDNSRGDSINAYADASDIRSAGILYGGTLTLDDLNNASDFFGLHPAITGYRDYNCGDTLNFSVGYQAEGAPVATASVNSVLVDKPAQPERSGGYPTLKLIPLKNANCDFRVIGYLPSNPTAGTAKLTIIAGIYSDVVYTLSDQTASGIIDLTFNPQTVFNGTIQDGIVSRDYQITSGSLTCGVQFYVDLEYLDTTGKYWATHNSPSASDYFITTANDQNSNGNGNNSAPSPYTISASRSMTGNCSISVVVSTSDFTYGGPFAIGIVNTDYSNFMTPYAAASFDEFPENGIVSATLSLASVNDMSANVPLTYKSIGNDDPTCGGYFRAILVAAGPGVILNSSLFNLNPSTCNAGWLLDPNNQGCFEVQRGFYTTELNSSAPIPCPAGMTTATTASKSVNDCYKPIAQTITGLKSPKTLKFGGNTNLNVITNTNATAVFNVLGPCSARLTNVITNVKGKKVATKALKVTAGKKAGICLINLSSLSSGKYLELRQVVQIKVTKTGK